MCLGTTCGIVIIHTLTTTFFISWRLYFEPLVEQAIVIEARKVLTYIRSSDQFSGDNSDCEPPDPFSNSEVKPVSADDSVGFPCESRTSPDLYIKPCKLRLQGFFYCLKEMVLGLCGVFYRYACVRNTGGY